MRSLRDSGRTTAGSWSLWVYNGAVVVLIVMILVMTGLIARKILTRPGPGPGTVAGVDSVSTSNLPASSRRQQPRRFLDDVGGVEAERTLSEAGNRTFVMVLGAEGTGSTWMARVLPADHRVLNNVRNGVGAMIHRLWSCGPMHDIEAAREWVAEAMRSAVSADAHRVLLHVSAPDWDADHYPDIHSSLWHLLYRGGFALRLVVMHRDGAEAAHSNFRRRWKHLLIRGQPDIARSARSTEWHMTLLAAQIEALPWADTEVLVIPYASIASDAENQAARLAQFLGLPPREERLLVGRLRASHRRPSNYRHSLTPDQVDYLERFFDAERTQKWETLARRAHSPLHPPPRP